MSMDKFMASVRQEGLMRTARFEVSFNTPEIFAKKGIFTGDVRKVLLYCDAVNLPGLSLSTSQSRTFGELREMPWEKLFDNINMSFYLDNTMQVKLFFDNWIGNIQDPKSRNFAYYKDYITDLKITILDTKSKARYEVTLYEAYPKAITAVNFDMASKEVAKLQVSMNYKFWTSALMEQGASVSNYPDQAQSMSIPNQYFSDFNAFTSGINSLEGINISPNAVEENALGIGRSII